MWKWMRNDVLCTSTKGEAHLEADFALLAAEAGQHEEDEGEETREGDGHHSQGGRPGQPTQRSAICRTQQVLPRLTVSPMHIKA